MENSSSSTAIAKDFSPFFRVYTDGRIEKYHTPDFLPPSEDHKTGVVSKDVVIVPENNVSARIYLPKTASINENQKLPLLIYIHGGGFCIESAFSTLYHNYVNHLVAEANVVAVSIEYRLAPEHPIPACYEDSWAVLKWVSGMSDPWLKKHADFNSTYLAGDSAGANIAHDMMIRAGNDGVELGNEIKLVGMVLIHPFFGIDKPDRIWSYISPESEGINDPRLNPAVHPSILSKLVCSKVMVCIAGKDFLRERGYVYYEALKKSGWTGQLEFVETEGEDHVFHLFRPTCENAPIFLKQVASFIKPNSVCSSHL